MDESVWFLLGHPVVRCKRKVKFFNEPVILTDQLIDAAEKV